MLLLSLLREKLIYGFSSLNWLLHRREVLRQIRRPTRGWLRMVRLSAGVSASVIADRMGVSRQLPLQLEIAEAEDRITLKSLRAVANVLECDLVYALVPREGPLLERLEHEIAFLKRNHPQGATLFDPSQPPILEEEDQSHPSAPVDLTKP